MNAIDDSDNTSQLLSKKTGSTTMRNHHNNKEASNNNDACNNNDALMIFSPTWIRRFNDNYRLSTTYAGVRRVRPSSRTVHQALLSKTTTTCTTNAASAEPNTVVEPVVFKVVDPETGKERRMTATEKKQAKRERQRRLDERKKEAKAQQKAAREAVAAAKETQQQQQEVDRNEPDNNDDHAFDISTETLSTAKNDGRKNDNSNQHHQYVQLHVNPTALEQELADLQGERSGVPPVLVSFAQRRAAVAAAKGLCPVELDHTTDSEEGGAVVSSWTQQWANALRQSFGPPTRTRQGEEMREMAYDIVPQPWTRMRPALVALPTNEDKNRGKDNGDSGNTETMVSKDVDPEMLLSFSMRPPCTSKDEAMAAVVACLHQCLAGLHVSCGAKFGCDFLLYDGPRSERHAFAGLRVVVVNDNDDFPLPRAYDLAGYVRCLNTAGKLALLATVVPATSSNCSGNNNNDNQNENNPQVSRVAIMDLALERIRNDSHNNKKRKRPAKTLEQRYSNLSKK